MAEIALTALDTSVALPSLAAWHRAHEVCVRAAAGARLPAHVVIETYSVLTRVPQPHRVSGLIAREAIRRRFPADATLTLPPAVQRTALDQLADAGVEGGATYDGLVGLTAKAHGEVLLTRDERAARTYRSLGVPFELLGQPSA